MAGLTRNEAAYNEANRAFDSQVGDLSGMRTRASTLLAAAALVTSFFGSAALRADKSGHVDFDAAAWAAVGSFLVVVLGCLFILAPIWNSWHSHVTVQAETEAGKPTGLLNPAAPYDDDVQAHVAAELEGMWVENGKILSRMSIALSVGIIALGVEIICWTIKLVQS